MEIITKGAKETKEFGKKFGSDLKKIHKRNKALVIALSGNLGSGKTTFLQGFAKGLGIEKRILSPTFILMRRYPLKSKGYFFHIDLYRFEGNTEEEVTNIGFFDIMNDPSNIIAIEWAEKVKNIIPKEATWIMFEYKDIDNRIIKIQK